MKRNSVRLGWVISEEVAHCYLEERAGIPHGGSFIEVLLQELFGAWTQCSEYLLTGRVSWASMKTTPVPPYPADTEPGDLPSDLGYHVGKHIAATALGSEDNRRHLDRWLRDPSTDPRVVELVNGLLEALPWDGSPSELAEALGAFYDALRGSGPQDG